jgi:hypothetical protein
MFAAESDDRTVARDSLAAPYLSVKSANLRIPSSCACGLASRKDPAPNVNPRSGVNQGEIGMAADHAEPLVLVA